MFIVARGTPNSILFMTEDGGETFTRVSLPFVLSTAFIFHPAAEKADLLMALSDKVRLESKDKTTTVL